MTTLSQNSPKVVFLQKILICTLNGALKLLYAIFVIVRRKSMYLRTWGSFKSANHEKRLGTQIAHLQSATFAAEPQI